MATKYNELICERTPGFEVEVCLDYFNSRIRVDDYRGDPTSVYQRARELAEKHHFSKVIIKSRETDWRTFLSLGMALEGLLDGYFADKDAYFLSAFLDPERSRSAAWIDEDGILRKILALRRCEARPALDDAYLICRATPDDAEELSALYRSLFEAYPSPITDASYLESAIRSGALFLLARERAPGEVASALSAEINIKYRNAEVTDCATLPAHQGRGIMAALIAALEEELGKLGAMTAYSIARARSFGMNAALYRLGYRYTGRMTNNCAFSALCEDMNLWCKRLGFQLPHK